MNLSICIKRVTKNVKAKYAERVSVFSIFRNLPYHLVNLITYMHNKLSSIELENGIFHIIRLKHFIIIECFACKKSDGD